MSGECCQGERESVVGVQVPGYVDLVEIGRGGFGIVYRAFDPALRRRVAVKVLAGSADGAAQRGFARECSAMSRLCGHPNIVAIHATGMTSEGQQYFVMPLAGRGSIADLLDAKGGLSWPVSVRLAIRLAGALETTHRSGIIHGDVKPANILVSDYDEPLLGDFGNARIDGSGDSGPMCATLSHAAPETFERVAASVTSDVYSLGSTLFNFVRGRPAFELAEAEEWASLYRRIATQPVRDLRPRRVPHGVWAAIEHAMAKSPEDRPASAAEFGLLLQDAQREARVAVTEMVIGRSHPQAWTELSSRGDLHVPVGERHVGTDDESRSARLGWVRGRLLRRGVRRCDGPIGRTTTSLIDA